MVSPDDRIRENRRALAEMERIEGRTAAYAADARRLLRRHLWSVLVVATFAGVAGSLLATSAGLVENVLILQHLGEQLEEQEQILRELDEQIDDRHQTLRELVP